MSENTFAKSEKLERRAKQFLYPGLVYPALLVLWGLAAAVSFWLTGHGISLDMSFWRIIVGFIPLTIPWVMIGLWHFDRAEAALKAELKINAKCTDPDHANYSRLVRDYYGI